MITLSKSLTAIPPSATASAADRARRMRDEGHEVLDLSGGEPGFETPHQVVEAAVTALRSGDTHYTEAAGIAPLRGAIATYLRGTFGIDHARAEDIIVTPSAKFGLFASLAAAINPGDEVVVPNPAWVSFAPMVKMLGGIPVPAYLSASNSFEFDEERVFAAVTKRTRAIIINSPNNPTGRSASEDQARSLLAEAQRVGILLIADDIYAQLMYDGKRHHAIAAMGEAENVITVNGLSKSHAMTGWRLGFVHATGEAHRAVRLFQEHSISCAASFAQTAAIVAYEGAESQVEEMRSSYEKNRDILFDALTSLPGVDVYKPGGGFYLFPNFTDSILGSDDPCKELARRCRIMGTPGVAFDPRLAGYVRLSFAGDADEIARAAAAIRSLASG